MSLEAGTSLGSYEIAAKLGEGGMGEVYRARDTKLDRDVAIKVLPEALTGNPDSLARFEREAKVLAQLHHPHVASIFGLEEAGGTRALVLELVEGPTLADRLERGALPVDEALEIARQIAEALEAAHEKGIVHRDLKPGNVKAPPDAPVKVLDFGLAKAMDPAATASGGASASQLAHSPTLTLGATVQGVVLGTAAYMAPEQAKGTTVDKRADVWAFGVVLWEMLAGRRLFEGDSVPEILAGVLKSGVELDALPTETPPAIRRLLRRCLERNPRNRLHDIADARIVIEETLQPGAVDDVPAGEADRAVVSRPTPLRGLRLAPWVLLLLAAGAAAGWWAAHRPAPSRQASGLEPSLRRLTDLPGLESSPSLSPDGKQLAYSSAASGNEDIYVVRVDGGRAINLTASSDDDDEQPAFSPDGQRIAFRSSRDGGGLFVMGATGESVRRLTDEGFDPAWSPDGTHIAYAMEPVIDPYRRDANAALWIVDVASGEKRRLSPVDAVQPDWSPDGRFLAYWANDAGQRDLWTIAVAGGDPVAVTRDLPTDWSPEWSPDGRWLYFSSDRAGAMNLFRVPIDPTTGGAAGAPEPVTTSVGNLGWMRMSADGRRMVVAAYERGSVLDFYRLDPDLPGEPSLQSLRTLRSRSLHWCALSRQADWLACVTLGTPEDLVLMRPDGSELRRLTDDSFKDRNVNWSPDGTRLIFQSTREGGWSSWSLRTDGSELRHLVDFESTEAAWTPDGRRFTGRTPDGSLVDLDASQLTHLADAEIVPRPASMQIFAPVAWSPSGRLLGGTEIDVLEQALSVGALDPSTGTYLRSELPMSGFGYARFAGWLPDSRHFVAAGDGRIALVDVETGAWKELKATDEVVEQVSLAFDGTLLVETSTVDGDVWLLERAEGPGENS